jgi:hypothetical protein
MTIRRYSTKWRRDPAGFKNPGPQKDRLEGRGSRGCGVPAPTPTRADLARSWLVWNTVNMRLAGVQR